MSNICIPIQEFKNIQQLASNHHQENDTRGDLYHEKRDLHFKSQKAVKNWGDTMVGQREKRLLAIEEKARLEEEERLIIDKEWALLKAQERNRSIERARNLQRMESPRYKYLHSQLLLQSVLMERDMQVERKSKLAEMRKQNSNFVNSNVFLKSEEDEVMQLEADRSRRLQIAEYQKSQIEQKRNLEKMRKEAEFDHYVTFNKNNSHELEQIKRDKVKKAQNVGKALESIIQSKKSMIDKAKQDQNILDLENEKFHERRAYIAAKHKEVVDCRSASEKQIYDQIAPIFYKAEQEKPRKIEEFIQKGVAIYSNDRLDRNRIEKEAREAELRDINVFRRKQIEDKKKQAETKRKEELAIKKEVDEAFAQYVKQKENAAENKKFVNQRYKDLQLEQIRQKADQAALSQRNAVSDHSKNHQLYKNEELEFDIYAHSILEEWKAAGRPSNIISRSVQKLKEQKAPKEPYTEGIKLDTFSRLGFHKS